MCALSAAGAWAQGLTFGGTALTPLQDEAPRSSGLEAVYILDNTRGVTASFPGQGQWSRFGREGGGYAEPVSSSMIDGGSTITLTAGEDMGYIVTDAQGRQHCYWVVDYSRHRASLQGLAISPDSDCAMAVLDFQGQATPITYYSINGAPLTLSRELQLTYNTLRYDQEAQAYVNAQVEKTMPSIDTRVTADAPLCDTQFSLRGDRFLQAWGQAEEVTSPTYHTLSVEATTTATQTATGQRPENEMKSDYPLGGSAPCEIQFTSQVTDAAIFREWQMSRDPNFEAIDMRANDLDWTYTFRDQGTWYVRFQCADASGMCDYISETYTVGIAGSYLKCPNAFSPFDENGVNDEWRVSYRSLVKYECHIFNRWGKELFSSRDPGEGWNGKTGNKFVPSGVYFYVVQATGADGKQYKLSGDINIVGYNPNARGTADNPQFE